MNIAVVIVVAAAAAIIGDNIGYAIGHMQGRQVARTLWPVRLDSRPTRPRRELFNRHGGKLVAAARFFDNYAS
jgi:membrane protein DedA with SNARE-associated domain